MDDQRKTMKMSILMTVFLLSMTVSDGRSVQKYSGHLVRDSKGNMNDTGGFDPDYVLQGSGRKPEDIPFLPKTNQDGYDSRSYAEQRNSFPVYRSKNQRGRRARGFKRETPWMQRSLFDAYDRDNAERQRGIYDDTEYRNPQAQGWQDDRDDYLISDTSADDLLAYLIERAREEKKE